MLLYGGFDGSSETTAALGREVLVALEAVGLHTEWDGAPGRAITVTPLDRRRRLVGWGPALPATSRINVRAHAHSAWSAGPHTCPADRFHRAPAVLSVGWGVLSEGVPGESGDRGR